MPSLTRDIHITQRVRCVPQPTNLPYICDPWSQFANVKTLTLKYYAGVTLKSNQANDNVKFIVNSEPEPDCDSESRVVVSSKADYEAIDNK
jgi:hypothetical protein